MEDDSNKLQEPQDTEGVYKLKSFEKVLGSKSWLRLVSYVSFSYLSNETQYQLPCTLILRIRNYKSSSTEISTWCLVIIPQTAWGQPSRNLCTEKRDSGYKKPLKNLQEKKKKEFTRQN